MADKIVQLVDKNSNNLYPVAGAVIDNAVSTGAISSQAVTNPKIENGAVNGVENNATAIGTAKLALDTVGTPNLRDASVTSDKIDLTTLHGDTTTVTINEPGKWMIIASVTPQPTGSSSSPNYTMTINWIGQSKISNGVHTGATNYPAYDFTFINVIDVQTTYTSTCSTLSTRLQQWRQPQWVAIKVGPAS